MNIEFYDFLSDNDKLKFVVINARYKDEWIFVRHKERDTWEMPGGHIEKDEMPDKAAGRELYEETGAIDYKLIPICDYSVEIDGIKNYGRLYYADVVKLDDLGDFEIAEIMTKEELPTKLTYGEIIPILHKKIVSELELRDYKT
ncbi:hypothetical protein SH1V18_44290 [Vallitalea longa]|uniref:Nudix hydrolase domain-containing protein n=1 Tax=Vallitalea longa TaxID=2936439 RepID=A0A9W5YF71_9FIRM|nr:NUDIX domain-containing protein [Vallitalea longa]GKX31949.1 hypothetical protein SH1V18_44290 [Vallitalea longa]